MMGYWIEKLVKKEREIKWKQMLNKKTSKVTKMMDWDCMSHLPRLEMSTLLARRDHEICQVEYW